VHLRRETRGRRPPLLLLGAAAVAVVVTAIPLAYLIVRTVEAGGQAIFDALWRERTLDTTLTSISLVIGVIIGASILAVPTAWLLARTNVPGRSFFMVTAALPLAVPSYVMAYAWIAEFPWMSGLWAAVLVMSLATYPYVAIPLTAALRTKRRDHWDLARWRPLDA
jgi:iron(III) transport system permease protein